MALVKKRKLSIWLKQIKKITKKPLCKKGVFLATLLSLICSSSACAANVSVLTNATKIPAVIVDNQPPFFLFGFYYTS
jgi:hypothetical protein